MRGEQSSEICSGVPFVDSRTSRGEESATLRLAPDCAGQRNSRIGKLDQTPSCRRPNGQGSRKPNVRLPRANEEDGHKTHSEFYEISQQPSRPVKLMEGSRMVNTVFGGKLLAFAVSRPGGCGP